ncbi:transcription factor Adf-1-like [Anthonomus grandis grandis]|uniref:transcription factor Adf-1-like n=1 Tax=Anthonomus grandis grandis TaxID=2921223 RepID=UPI0021668589|nr:transcription factor Adf-1-like [Anthonomus grandis grandis]
MTTMEILISEVVWNKKYHRYKDRTVVDKEWDEISISTGLPKDDAKKKWRNLRDQFTKELKKISKPRSGDPQEFVASYSRKWQYFANMLFLKDTLIPRNTEGNISLNVLEASESTTAINDDDEVEKEVIDHEPNPNNDALQSDVNIDTQTQTLGSQAVETLALTSSAATTSHFKRKRNQKHTELEQKFVDIENKKLALLKTPEDENMLFSRSLLL